MPTNFIKVIFAFDNVIVILCTNPIISYPFSGNCTGAVDFMNKILSIYLNKDMTNIKFIHLENLYSFVL